MNTFKPGDTVRMVEDAEVSTARDEAVVLPAGTTGKVVRVINDSAVYVKVGTRQYVIWTADLETPDSHARALMLDYAAPSGKGWKKVTR